MTRRVERELGPTPASVRAARQFVQAALASWDLDDVSELAGLLTSEVVTNAVLHARMAYRLTVEVVPPEVVIEVRDSSTVLPAGAEGPARPGLGLALLDAFANRWGVRPEGGGKAVWFTLSLTRSPPAFS